MHTMRFADRTLCPPRPAGRAIVWKLGWLLMCCVALFLLGQAPLASAMPPDCESHAQQVPSSPTAGFVLLDHKSVRDAAHPPSHGAASPCDSHSGHNLTSHVGGQCDGSSGCAVKCAASVPALACAGECAQAYDARQGLPVLSVSDVPTRALIVETPPPRG